MYFSLSLSLSLSLSFSLFAVSYPSLFSPKSLITPRRQWSASLFAPCFSSVFLYDVYSYHAVITLSWDVPLCPCSPSPFVRSLERAM